ncbi:GAP family protein [Streptomyces sp. FXJ1.4098]|nr:GAP family protein [Streptomyces sp. FXJ1.4098]
MDLQILPLAVTMMAGPQIVAAVILVTAPRPVRVSLAFLLGVAVATAAGVTITRGSSRCWAKWSRRAARPTPDLPGRSSSSYWWRCWCSRL